MDDTSGARAQIGRRLAALGAALVLLGLLTGFVSGNLANPRMGLASHLEGLMNGTLLIALGAGWGHVRLGSGAERLARWSLVGGGLANWLATLLAAVWGAGRTMMPLAAGAHRAAPWQETTVSALLVALSLAMVVGIALVLWGLLQASPSHTSRAPSSTISP